jgi:hypothetical protein
VVFLYHPNGPKYTELACQNLGLIDTNHLLRLETGEVYRVYKLPRNLTIEELRVEIVSYQGVSVKTINLKFILENDLRNLTRPL